MVEKKKKENEGKEGSEDEKREIKKRIEYN